MRPRQQVWLGAALGAIAVLLLHQGTRPYYASALWRFGDSDFLSRTQYLPENVRVAPDPTSPMTAAYWMQISAEMLQKGRPIRPADVEKLIAVASYYGAKEPENAFWPQMESVWRGYRDDSDGWLEPWRRAGKRLRWKDYQAERLDEIAEGLIREFGGRMSWHEAMLLHFRSDAVCGLLQDQARRVWRKSDTTTREGLELRSTMVRNGYLMFEGVHSLKGGDLALGILAMAPRTGVLGSPRTQKGLLIARFDLINAMFAAGMDDEARAAVAAFKEQDSWPAFANQERAQAQTLKLTSLAALYGAAPGALLALSVFGLALLGLGTIAERSSRIQWLFGPVSAPALGAALAILLYFLTRLPVPSLWAAICLGFFAYTPRHVRTARPEYLGLLFRLTLFVLGATLCGLLFLFLIGIGPVGVRLLPHLPVPREFGSGSLLLLGLSGIVFGLILSMAPAWGIVQKHRPSMLVGLALREAGTGIFVACLALSILAGPIAMVLDRGNADELHSLRLDEPRYYETR